MQTNTRTVNAHIASVALRPVVNTALSLRELQPQSVITDVLGDIANPALRHFMDVVLHESLIHGLITLPLVRHGLPVQFPIQLIRRAAKVFGATQARTRQEKDLLLAASVLWGIRSLLPLSIYGKTDLHDIFCTLIRPALHGLDDRTYEVSMALRALVGLGDEAMEYGESMSHLQRGVERTMVDMHRCNHWLLPCMKEAIERQTERGVMHFAQRACQ